MTNRLVLSIDGGGTKGMFMHHSMSNLNQVPGFKPDLIVAVSAGAIVGALYATGLNESMTPDIIRSWVTILFKASTNVDGPWFSPSYCGKTKRQIISDIYGDLLFGKVNIPMAILVDTIGGSPMMFKSWDPDHGKLTLCEILDATTAVPVLFPPVSIGDQLHIDGGTVASSPTTLAYLVSKLFFSSDDEISLISIGINKDLENIDQLSTSTFDRNNVGILQLLAIGLPIHMMTRGPTLSNEMTGILLGNNYLRIQGDVYGDIDDPLVIDQCKVISDRVWKRDRHVIGNFIKKFLEKSRI
jgi:hypothetical protein